MGHDSSICDMTHLREIKSALGGCARARERERECVCECVSGVGVREMQSCLRDKECFGWCVCVCVCVRVCVFGCARHSYVT